jgi:ADP-ribose pyrophosphatase
MSGLFSMLSGTTKDIQLSEVDVIPSPQQDDNGDMSLADMTKYVVKMQSLLRGIRARRDLPPGFGTFTVESSPHAQARSENNPLYRGKRTPVKDDQVPWSVTWEEYEPAAFTSKVVLDNGREQPEGMKWADPPDPKLSFHPDLEKRLSFENGGVIIFDPEGYPLNPRGRTGLRGRGLLGNWGPNHAADPIVTRREPLTGTIQVRRSGTEAALRPTAYPPAPIPPLPPDCSDPATWPPLHRPGRPPLQVLAIKRNDTGEWALPGGMVKPGDSVSATVKKSINEVGSFKDPAKQEEFDALVKVLFAKGVDVHAGYADDPRNTDNAWMESKVMHFHCSPELGEMLPLNIKKSKDKKEKGGQVGWIDCTKSQEPRYANMVHRHSRPPLHSRPTRHGSGTTQPHLRSLKPSLLLAPS